MLNTTVTIIGAGVSGLYLSRKLERAGIDFITVEQNNFVGKYGNRVINKEVFESLELPEDLIKYPINKINFYSPAEIKLSKSDTEARGYVINLMDVEKFLFNSISDKSKILFGRAVLGVSPANGIIHTEKGEIKSDLIVFATGAMQNRLRAVFGVKSPRIVVCYMAEIVAEDVTTVILDNRTAYGFYGWVMPLGAGRAEIGFGSEYRGALNLALLRQRMFTLPYLWKFKDSKPIKENVGFIPISIVNKLTGTNCILIGDAGGGEPAMGGSIHKCIDEADLVIVALTQRRSSESAGECYNRLWKDKFTMDFKTQDKMRALIDTSNSEDIDNAFKALQGKEIPGTGLINDLFKNIIHELIKLKERDSK